jgi:hypothetical protein
LRNVPAGRLLGSGVLPACRDTDGASAADEAEPVKLRAIRGVNPRLAILAEHGPRGVYINSSKRSSSKVDALLRRLRRR